MAKVYINRFDGGLAQSERPETINENSLCQGFDIFYDSYKLRRTPTPNQIDTDGTSSELMISDAVKRDTDGLIVGVGTINASSLTAKFYSKTTSITTNWIENTQTFGGAGMANSGNGFVTLYKGNFYGTIQESANTTTYKYTNDTTVVSVGQVGDYNAVTPKPIVHGKTGLMFVAGGKKISKYDGTTWTASALTIDNNIVSLCEYGSYLAVGFNTFRGGFIGLWNQEDPNYFSDIIPVDSGKLMIVESLNGVLTSVSESPYDPNVSAGVAVTYETRNLTVRQYVGTTMQKVKSARYSNTNEGGQTQALLNKKMIKDGTLYFSTGSNYLWRFGKNQNGEYVLSQDMRIAYTGRDVVGIYGIFNIGDYIYSCQRTTTGSPSDGLLVRTDANSGYSSSDTSTFTTTINPSMSIPDRKLDKTLLKVGLIAYANSTLSGSVKIECSVDNGVTYVTCLTQSATFPSKYIKYVATENNDISQLPSGVELIFKITITGQIDVVGLFYEYDPIDPLLE